MKQKINQIFLFGLVFSYLFYIIYPFSFSFAQANIQGCRVDVQTIQAANSITGGQQITRMDTINVVTRSQVDAQCLRGYSLTYKYYVKKSQPAGAYKFYERTLTVNSLPNQGKADFDFTFDVKSILNITFPNPNKFEYYLIVSPASNQNIELFNNINANMYLDVSGQTTGSGNPQLSDIFLRLDKAAAITGTTLYLDINVYNSDLTKITDPPPFKILTYVNNTLVGQIRDKTKTEIGAVTTQQIVVNSQNGFKPGPNQIRVDIHSQTTNNLVARGIASITMPGEAGSSSISYSPAKNNYSLGDTIVLKFNNVPAGWTAEAEIDGNKIPISNDNFSLVLNANNKFKDNSNNQINIKAFDSAKNEITLSGTPINISIGVATGSGGGGGTGAGGGSSSASDHLQNPLPFDGLLETFLGITKGFLAGLAIWAVIAIIFAGFRMVIAAGNEEAIMQAKKAITWAILGLVIALLSFSIVAIVQNLLKVDVDKFDPRGVTDPATPSSYNIRFEKNKV